MSTYVPAIVTLCPHCGSKLKCPARMAGNRETCPDCAELVDVPYKSNAPRTYSAKEKWAIGIGAVAITILLAIRLPPEMKRQKAESERRAKAETVRARGEARWRGIEKRKAEKIAARYAICGPEPKNSSWDSSIPSVKAYLRATLRDPGSVQYIEWSKPILVGAHWEVRVKYRAKNGFGGYVILNQIAAIQNRKVIFMRDYR